MSATRAPSAPPELPGFTYVELLGSGGFADVFLYEQALPQRRVAVKVLLADRLSRGAVADFSAEANIMAQLSTHPAIVTIYQAGVSDDGRPYLVMEYCPKPNLQVRYRREPFSIAEALRVGVQVAAAVETAHRAGILHRDIKPANILVTEYNRPALTDFGIAVTAESEEELTGMSIPWSPPEAFIEAGSPGRTADVYSLGATVYTLLAGRSPFEIPGERNSSSELIQRILSQPVVPMHRADAPAMLVTVLERAMATSPADRYETALDFARALQRVQLELNMAPTPIDVIDDRVDDDAEEDDDGGLTRVRGIVNIDPSLPPPRVRASGATSPAVASTNPAAPTTIGPTVRRDAGTLSGAGVGAAADATVRAPRAGGSIPQFEPGPPASAAPSAPAPSAPVPPPIDSSAPPPSVASDSAPAAPAAEPKPRRKVGAIVGTIAAAVVVLAGAGVAIAAGTGILEPAATPSPAASDDGPIDGVLPVGAVPPVEDLAGAPDGGSVIFRWTNPAPEDGDYYLWGVQRLGEEIQVRSTTDATVTVPAEAAGRTCIEVTLVRADRTSSAPAEACAP